VWDLRFSFLIITIAIEFTQEKIIVMSVSSSDLKHVLRKTDFPFCARETLVRVGRLGFYNFKAR
jgi:hypothetical protein